MKKFGDKYLIDTNRLINNNSIHIIYEKTKIPHPGINKAFITNDFKNLLLNIINYDKFNNNQYNILDKKEKDYLIDILNKTKLINKYNLNELLMDDEKKDIINKFHVLISMYNEGNNTQIIKNDIINLLKKMLSKKIITKKIFGDIIYDIV